MHLFRIVKSKTRSNDLSGTGAYRLGGRWNNKGTYMLYTSESSSLALLENLVHFGQEEFPPKLYIIKLALSETASVFELPEPSYPNHWRQPELEECKIIGDKIMQEQKYIAIKVRSAVNPIEYNYLLNPLYPGFTELVKIKTVSEIKLDERLIR